jgi:hypothetical protein
VKGAIAVSTQQGLLDHLSSLMETLEVELVYSNAEGIQVSDSQGRLFAMYNGAEPDWEWRNAEGLEAFDGRTLPDMSNWFGYAIECRWEDLFCQVLRVLGASVPNLFVIDGDGFVWPAAEVDPSRIRL